MSGKKWGGNHHKNANRTDGEFCSRCGKRMTQADPAKMLELNCATGLYRTDEMPRFPAAESQGWFAFGATCAAKTIKEQSQ